MKNLPRHRLRTLSFVALGFLLGERIGNLSRRMTRGFGFLILKRWNILRVA